MGSMPPLSAIQPDDHAGNLWIVSILTAIYVLLSVVVRGHVKWGVYGIDDYILVVATILFLGQIGAVFHGLRHGLSKFNSITTESDWKTAGKSFLACEILAILTLCLTKCSVISFMHRVFSCNTGWKLALSISAFVLSAAWGVAGMVAITINCNPDTVLTVKNLAECPGQVTRWRALTIVDLFTDALICLMPIGLTYALQMPFKVKCQVILAFGLRFPVIIFSAMHFDSIARFPTAEEPLFTVTNALLYQQAMMLWSLISATIPNTKAFVKSFSTDFGLAMGLEIQTARDYPLQNLTIGSARTRSSRKGNQSIKYDDDRVPINKEDELDSVLRPDVHQHRTTVVHAVSDGGSIGSHGSQDLIIRKEVKWQVRTESNVRIEDSV